MVEGVVCVEWVGDMMEEGWCMRDTVVHIGGLDIFWSAGDNFGRDVPCQHNPSTVVLEGHLRMVLGFEAGAAPPAS